ncbi:MAG: NUDIX domain-containing protein [Pseudomonadota bacterium]|nr:NUDIX domain-containing protein [Pseudomonadota bacterium]
MVQTVASFPFPVKPAATVVIFRLASPGQPPELLMVQRAKNMRFAGGAAVFPGGRVDEADRILAGELLGGDLDEAAARIAAIRETLEETGLAICIDRPVTGSEAAQARQMLLANGELAPVLAHMGWRIMPDVLTPFARWCPRHEGSFDTRFYLADLGTGAVDITVDQTENTHLFWATAADALAMADRGEISVIFPTRRNLERLALFGSFAAARAQALAHPVRMISPATIEKDGVQWLTIPDDQGYPVTRQTLATAKRGLL